MLNIGRNNHMSRNMIEYFRSQYPGNADKLMKNLFNISESALQTYKTNSQEFRDLLKFYFKDHQKSTVTKNVTRIYIPKSH